MLVRPDKQIVIGFGTGRCGSQSLAALLNAQKGYFISHEGLPLGWTHASGRYKMAMKMFDSCEAKYVGDVGWYWLRFIDRVLQDENAKAIWLYRDIDEVVESFWAYKKPAEVEVSGLHDEEGIFYQYPFVEREFSKEALHRCMDRYLLECEVAYTYLPNIYKFPMQYLNDDNEVLKLLEWLGVEDPIIVHPHLNTSAERIAENNDDLNMQLKVQKWREMDKPANWKDVSSGKGFSFIPDKLRK